MNPGLRFLSATHLAALAGVVLAIVGLIALGRRWRSTARGHALEWSICLAILLLRGGVIAWNLRPSRFDVASSLPLQICDLAAIAAAVALVRPARWARALSYFWGLALSIQALLTPDLGVGVGDLGFWAFWLHHALIEGAAIYIVVVGGYRPVWRDLGMAVGWGIAYVAVIFPLDVIMGSNYGYVGRGHPQQPSLIDVLGPWPGRVVWIVVLGIVAMSLLLVPWLLIGRQPARVGTPAKRV